MKKIITLLIFLTVTICAQDVTSNLGWGTTTFRDTLTSTIDTIDVKFRAGDYFTISVVSSGTDTIYVFTRTDGANGLWSRKAILDLSTNSVVTEIIATTTTKEYLILEPPSQWIRLVTPDASAASIFTLTAKTGNYSVNGATPATLPLPSGAATSAKQDVIIGHIDGIETILGYNPPYSTVVSGNVTIGASADTLSGTSVACKGVVVTNNSAGKVLYVIHNGSGTTSTGTPIYYLGSMWIPVSNLNKVYLISDSASTDVRFIYYQ